MDTRKQATNTDLHHQRFQILALSNTEYETTLLGVAYRYKRWREKNEQAKKRPLNIFRQI